MDFLHLIWLIGGFILIFLEFVVPGFVIFFFGAGAILTGLLTWLLPGLGSSVLLQTLLWLGTSSLTLGFFRRRLSPVFKGKTITAPDEIDAEEDIGLSAEVSKAIRPEKPGRIRLRGTTWEARSFDESFETGDRVEILKREGMVYYVTKSLVDFDIESI